MSAVVYNNVPKVNKTSAVETCLCGRGFYKHAEQGVDIYIGALKVVLCPECLHEMQAQINALFSEESDYWDL